MAFPPAHMLVGAGLAELACAGLRNPPPRWVVWPIAAILAAGPDADIVIGILRGRGGAYHGTFSHSLTAVVIIALVGYALGGGRWAAMGGLAYGSHLLVDMLDESGPTNLMLGWPFTGARPYAIGKLFPKVPVKGDGMVDTALNVLRPQALTNFLVQTLIAAAIFGALLLMAAVIRRRRARRDAAGVGISGARRRRLREPLGAPPPPRANCAEAGEFECGRAGAWDLRCRRAAASVKAARRRTS